jgi:hypothetical protein
MLVIVNGKVVAETTSSELLGINSVEEAQMFKKAYNDLGFDVTLESEYKRKIVREIADRKQEQQNSNEDNNDGQ